MAGIKTLWPKSQGHDAGQHDDDVDPQAHGPVEGKSESSVCQTRHASRKLSPSLARLVQKQFTLGLYL